MNFLSDTRNSKWLALALFVLTVITRIPFASQYLYHWDSVNMAFGMQHFNPADGAPHFPGYIAYIAIADLLNAVIGNPHASLVIISILSTGLAVVSLFYLGRAMFNPTIGMIAAVLLMTSPLVWFYSEIALPHTMDLFAVTLSALLLYKIMQGDLTLLWPTAIFLAFVGGFRYVTLVFLIPLIVFSGYRIGLKRIVGVGVVVALLTVIWVIPTLNATGGLQNYLTASRAFSAAFFTSTSLLSGGGAFALKRNVIEKLIPYTAYAWGLAALPVLYFVPQIPGRWRQWVRDRRVWFLLLWMLPSIGFYVVIHMGQQGYVFNFLPVCMLVSAKGLYGLFEQRPALLRGSAAALALVGAAIFIVSPIYPLGDNGPKLLTYNTIRQSDQHWDNAIMAVRNNFKPEDTLLVAAQWRHVQYYLPEYKLARITVGAKYEVTEGTVTDADYVNQDASAQTLGLTSGKDWKIVVMDDALNEFVDPTNTTEKITLADGFTLLYLAVSPAQAYWTDGQTFGVRAAASS